MQLPVIIQDKANHFIYGAIISAVSIIISYLFLDDRLPAGLVLLLVAVIGILSSVIMGLVKELMDLKANLAAKKIGQPPPHGVEIADAVYTAIGGILPAVPFLAIYLVERIIP